MSINSQRSSDAGAGNPVLSAGRLPVALANAPRDYTPDQLPERLLS
jgi:hypothetical protein